MLALCKFLRDKYSLAAVSTDELLGFILIIVSI